MLVLLRNEFTHDVSNELCRYVTSHVCWQDAIALLEPMTLDPVNYVRQGALIASAMILVQQNENTSSKVHPTFSAN